MPNKKISKTEAENVIDEFFSHLKNKTAKDVKKIKKLAMSKNIKLGDKRKLFCRKCFSPHGNSSINIKNDFVTIICTKCKHKGRWKLKKELDFKLKHHGEECC
ncbi:MAG: hypothetical protein ABIH49_03390 [archaeon]